VSAPSGHPFGQDELAGDDGLAFDPAELASILTMADELESVAREPGGRPSPDFVDRVSRAVAAEPLPAPAIVARESLRRLRPLGLLAAVRDAGRVAFGPGRTLAIRGQAFALLFAALLVVGSIGGVTALAAGQLIAPQSVPAATRPSASPSPSLSPSPTLPDAPSSDATAEPTAVPTTRVGQGGGGSPTETPDPKRPSASPTDRTRPSESPWPHWTNSNGSPDPGENDGNQSGQGNQAPSSQSSQRLPPWFGGGR
jgi:hypothetical protein